MGWLQEHLEGFVYPQVGKVDLNEIPTYFTVEEKTVLKNAWRAAKRAAGGKTIILPGRDVFVFEVLARRECYPTVFVPQCSRATVQCCVGLFPPDGFLLDTGFVGSIPKALGVEQFKLLSSAVCDGSVQLFPRLSGSRSLALKVEYSPKYWKSGFVRRVPPYNYAEPAQEFSSNEEFIRAAALTVEIYKDSSPKFKTAHRPLGGVKYERTFTKKSGSEITAAYSALFKFWEKASKSKGSSTWVV